MSMQAREKDDKMMRFIAMIGGMLGSGGEEVVVDEGKEGVDLEEEGGVTEEQAAYRPHIPGRILYIYRCQFQRGPLMKDLNRAGRQSYHQDQHCNRDADWA